MTRSKVAAIVAMDETRVIGRGGSLPWNLPEDMAHFRAQTTGHIVIMGRKTWESLPPRFRPLPNRLNIVVSRNLSSLELPEGVIGASSIEESIHAALERAQPGQVIWFIGGGELYRAALPMCDEVHLTLVSGQHQGDAFFPAFEENFSEVSTTPGELCAFKIYRRK